jgi:membrane protein YdbS with pleckstrin-like domain
VSPPRDDSALSLDLACLINGPLLDTQQNCLLFQQELLEFTVFCQVDPFLGLSVFNSHLSQCEQLLQSLKFIVLKVTQLKLILLYVVCLCDSLEALLVLVVVSHDHGIHVIEVVIVVALLLVAVLYLDDGLFEDRFHFDRATFQRVEREVHVFHFKLVECTLLYDRQRAQRIRKGFLILVF